MDLGGMVEIESSEDAGVPHAANLREREMQSSVPGLRVFSVSIGEEADSVPVVTGTISGDDQIFHKVFPGLKTPFGLPIECFPVYEKMLDKKPNLVDAVNVMLTGAVAESTCSEILRTAETSREKSKKARLSCSEPSH
jgi:hypothetical protein